MDIRTKVRHTYNRRKSRNLKICNLRVMYGEHAAYVIILSYVVVSVKY